MSLDLFALDIQMWWLTRMIKQCFWWGCFLSFNDVSAVTAATAVAVVKV